MDKILISTLARKYRQELNILKIMKDMLTSISING